jgi:protein-S-isoprenylcysteine O-methyltransferase Ste14
MPLQARKQLFTLVVAIALLLVLPALYFDVLTTWRILFLIISYFIFFFGITVWRIMRYGSLVKRENDRQLRDRVGQVIAVVTLFGLMGTHWLAIYEFSHVRLGDEIVVSAIAILIIVTAIFLSQIALNMLGRFFDRLAIKADHKLITTGIYRHIRHPIYTSYLLLFCGYCLLLKAWISLGLMVIVCTLWFGHRLQIEEQMLAEHFGATYRQYCQTTKRLLPFVY